MNRPRPSRVCCTSERSRRPDVRVGVQLQTHGVQARTMIDAAVMLASDGTVAGGFDSIWVWDHLVPFTMAPPAVAWEAWSSLGAMANALRGTGVSIGVLVSPLTFREPAVLARSAATVARILDGKMVLAVGAGGFIHDDRLAGTAMSTAERMHRFTERLGLLRGQIDEVSAATGADVELWVGGDGERVTIPSAARFADGWSGFGPPERFAQRRDVFERAVVECGRSPDEVSVSVLATRHNGAVTLAEWGAAGAHEVIVSVPPDGRGGYDVGLARALAAQRPRRER